LERRQGTRTALLVVWLYLEVEHCCAPVLQALRSHQHAQLQHRQALQRWHLQQHRSSSSTAAAAAAAQMDLLGGITTTR
jgi:prephenate dehydratase